MSQVVWGAGVELGSELGPRARSGQALAPSHALFLSLSHSHCVVPQTPPDVTSSSFGYQRSSTPNLFLDCSTHSEYLPIPHSWRTGPRSCDMCKGINLS